MTGLFNRANRAWLVGLTVLGLVAGLLGPGAERADGENGESDHPAVYSACVGEAAESAGFADAVGSFAENEINCIFHYGITKGRTATRFSTGETISRWQMALFLARGARAAGIVLPANPRRQDFRDIGGLSREARWAVNALSGAGIMPGVSAFSFEPNAGVTRASMATLLDGFLRAAVIGEGGTDPEKITPDDNVFTDIDRVSVATYNAIRRIYELDITKGQTETRFAPDGLVTRAQMAAFIARTLSHTTARPAGLSLQASSDEVSGSEGSVELVVSVRDRNFQPVVDAVVDLFYSSEPRQAFRSDGTCDAGRVISVDGSRPCVIDYGDSLTDELGDIVAISYAPISATTLWAWTGRLQDRFDEDSTAAQSLEIGYIPAPAQMLVTDDLAPNQEKLRLGQTVVFTLQLADGDGDPVPERDWQVTVSTSQMDVNGNTSSSTRTHKTDGEGQIRFSFRQNGTNADGETARVSLQLSAVATRSGQPSLPLVDKTTNKRIAADAVVPDGPDEGSDPDPHPDRGRYVANWAEEPSQPEKLSLTQRFPYLAASDDGRGAGNRVTALLTDQYGVPIRGKRILFYSDDQQGIGGDPEGDVRYRRTTNRRGESVLSYTRDEDDGGIETIWAVYEEVVGAADDADDRPDNDANDISLTADRLYHFWAETPGAAAVTGRILEKDPDDNRLVIAADEKVLLVEYDGNDHFIATNGRPTTFTDFEKSLAETGADQVAHLRVEFYSETAGRVSSFTARKEWPSILPPDDNQMSYDASGEPVPRQLPGGPPGTAVAADKGVIVIGVPHADLKNYDHDSNPNTAGQCPNGCGDAGWVKVYNSITDALPQVLTAPAPAAKAMFGTDVDIAGDTIVVGEPGDEWGDGRREGAAYIFVRNSVSGKWEHKGHLNDDNAGSGITYSTDAALGTDEYDRMFGRSVAISGDGQVAAIAVPYEDRIGRTSDPMTDRGRAGAVYLYVKPAAGWSSIETPKYTLLPAAESNEAIGMNKNLAISFDGTEVAVGSDSANDGRGRVYVFQTSSVATWNEPSASPARPTHPSDAVLTAPAEGANFIFGRRVGFDKAGDTLVIGSGSEDRVGGGHPGKIYVAEDDDWTSPADRTIAVLQASKPRIPDQFSQYVSINPEGTEVAGGRHNRREGGQRGSVALFKRDGTTWTVETASGGRGPTGEKQTGIDEEFLGAAPGDGLGWETTFDRTTGALYSSTRRDDPGGFFRFRLYQIQR